VEKAGAKGEEKGSSGGQKDPIKNEPTVRYIQGHGMALGFEVTLF